ncbi:unnamed protein product [Boreogadus saida]
MKKERVNLWAGAAVSERKVEEVVLQHQDVFSEIPGRTTGAQHDIKTAEKKTSIGGVGDGHILALALQCSYFHLIE